MFYYFLFFVGGDGFVDRLDGRILFFYFFFLLLGLELLLKVALSVTHFPTFNMKPFLLEIDSKMDKQQHKESKEKMAAGTLQVEQNDFLLVRNSPPFYSTYDVGQTEGQF